jgi:hypothetical protein
VGDDKEPEEECAIDEEVQVVFMVFFSLFHLLMP